MQCIHILEISFDKTIVLFITKNTQETVKKLMQANSSHPPPPRQALVQIEDME